MNNPLWIVALGVIGVGVLIAATPAEQLLRFDRRTGYGIYRRRLEASGDEKQAIAAAATFYRIFGLVFVAVGAILLLAGLLP